MQRPVTSEQDDEADSRARRIRTNARALAHLRGSEAAISELLGMIRELQIKQASRGPR